MPAYSEYSTDLMGGATTPAVQTPSVLASVGENYHPGFLKVQEAYLGSAFKGVGTAYFNVNELISRTWDDGSPTLTEEEWKNSDLFRPGLQYHEGLTEGSARRRADIFDDIRYREFVMGKATNAQRAAGFLTALIGGTFEPQNFVSGVAAAGLLGPGALFARSLPRAYGMTLGSIVKSKRSIAQAVGFGAVSGAVGDVIVEPVNYAGAKSFGEEYTASDVLMNIGQSALFGGAFEGGAQFIKNRRSTRTDRINEFDSTIAQLSEDVIPDASGQRRYSIAQKYSEIYGPVLNSEFDAFRFNILGSENATNPEFSTRSLVDFAPERTIHWATDSVAYHGDFNTEAYDASAIWYEADRVQLSWQPNGEPMTVSRAEVLEWLSKPPAERPNNPDIQNAVQYIFQDNRVIMNAGDPVHTGVMDFEASRFLSWVYQDPMFQDRGFSPEQSGNARDARTPVGDVGSIPKTAIPEITLEQLGLKGMQEDLHLTEPDDWYTREPIESVARTGSKMEETGANDLARVQAELADYIDALGDAAPEDLLAMADELRDRGIEIDNMMDAVVVCALRTFED